MIKQRDRILHLRRLQISEKHKGNKIRRALVEGYSKLLTYICPAYGLIKQQLKLEKCYQGKETRYVCDLGGDGRKRLEKDWLREFINVEFEGCLFPAPKEYEKVLTADYGDYMKLPPVEKQVANHSFEAYYLKDIGEHNERNNI